MARIESNHGPVVFIESLGDGEARVTLHALPTLDGAQVTVGLLADEVTALREALESAEEDG